MNKKGRPKKHRFIKLKPKIYRFSPRGKPGRPDEIELEMEEFEAIRLADLLGNKQEKAAKSMQISQATFSRILKRSRRKLSDAFINGKIIKIEGRRGDLEVK